MYPSVWIYHFFLGGGGDSVGGEGGVGGGDLFLVGGRGGGGVGAWTSRFSVCVGVCRFFLKNPLQK